MQLKSIFFIIALVAGAFVSSASYAGEEENAALISWIQTYYRLGIHPTKKEITTKMKKGGYDQEQIDAIIALDSAPSSLEMMAANEDMRSVDMKLANELLKISESATTKSMSQKALALIKEVHAEQKSRNVSRFVITEAKLKSLTHTLAARSDAEKDMRKLREYIATMSTAPMKNERNQIIEKISSFYQLEKDATFDSKGYSVALINEFNDHVNRLNERLKSEKRTKE